MGFLFDNDKSQKDLHLKNKIDDEEAISKAFNEKIASFNKEIKLLSLTLGTKEMQKLLNSLQQCEDKRGNESLIGKYNMFREIVSGLHVTKRENCSRSLFEPSPASTSAYEISIQCLPEDCLESEKKQAPAEVCCDDTSPLSYSVMDSVKKKKAKKLPVKPIKANTNKSCLTVNNVSELSTIFNNYINLICLTLTKQEIKEATKQFAIDWVEGSKLLTILINNKSSKMATVALPQYYPLTGTEYLRLTSLSDYDGSQIKDFQINENVNTLAEWITVFTRMFNSDMICPKTDNST